MPLLPRRMYPNLTLAGVSPPLTCEAIVAALRSTIRGMAGRGEGAS